MLKLVSVVVAGVTAMGGWAVVTVKDVPEYFVAGQQYTLEFQVRQHGRHLLNGLRPRLEMRSSQRDLGTIAAVSRPAEGTYAVTFTVPSVDRLLLTIQSGFGDTELRLYPVAVVAAGAPRPSMPLAERGQVLFVAKGCNTCHVNSDLTNRPDNRALTVGPALGGRHLATQVVIQKVKQASENMPDLGLTDSEAAAIAAFVSGGQPATGSR